MKYYNFEIKIFKSYLKTVKKFIHKVSYFISKSDFQKLILFPYIIKYKINSKMGPKNSKDSQVNFMKDYDVIQTNTTQNIKFLQHKKTEEEYLLKEFIFNDKKECDKTMEKLAELKTKLAGNKHVVPLKDYLMSSEDQYCSTFYKIYALFQYPQRTLDDEINERKLHRKRFTQTQLWSILASCIVGLSHLQKNGIKHLALKSNNILLSREGIIKVSDPFAMGQLSNYDSALTKRSTLHAYLSPEQTQALQQQLITPTYNTYKSDIFTLGMIMLQAGLLEYQDEECYRDDKTRIHWETVQYNIDRLGQAYSDEIKNMVEFMLSRDQRARPDWIDLEEHVMKSGDEVRRSMIQDQTKIEGSFINSEGFQGTPSNSKPIILNNRPSRTSQSIINPHNAPNVPTNVLIPNLPGLYNQTNSRVPIANQQIPAYQTFAGNTTTIPRHIRPESPRISQTINSNIYPNAINTNLPPPPTSTHIYNMPNFIGTGPTVLPTNIGVGQQIPNLMPLRPSIIDLTRPTRNIFPSDTYVTKTKFDQNLIIVSQDDQRESEGQNQQQFPPPFMKSSIPQQTYITTNTTANRFQNQMNRQPNIQMMNNYEPNRFNPPNTQGPVDITNFVSSQNRILTRPAPLSNFEQNQQRSIPPTLIQTNWPTSSNKNNQNNLQFVTEQFKMGSRYEGYKLNGMRHGYGKFYYQDGGMYDGDWKENKMQGFGKLYYQSGKLAYEGEWKNDQFTGKGVLYNEVPEMLDHNFNYNNFDDVDEYWTKYQGEFSDDMKNGKGTLYLSNGQRFQGIFVADSVEGPGVFYCRNGTKVSGAWRGNIKQR